MLEELCVNESFLLDHHYYINIFLDTWEEVCDIDQYVYIPLDNSSIFLLVGLPLDTYMNIEFVVCTIIVRKYRRDKQYA